MTSVDDGISLDEYKAQVDEALREYFLSNNVMELIQWALPSFSSLV